MDKEKTLLDELCVMTSCSYLSDLSSKEMHDEVISAIRKLDISSYPPSQWQEAANYITQNNISFTDSEQAKAFLLAY